MKGYEEMFAAIVTTVFTYFFFGFVFNWTRSVCGVRKGVGTKACS